MTEQPLLSVKNLKKHYPIRKGFFNRQVGAARAVDGISFDIRRGETVGLVGESGCGKSTAARSIIRLEEPTDGEVIYNGSLGAGHDGSASRTTDVTEFDRGELKSFRRKAQMIFQDPSSSFDPRMPVGDAIGEMLQVHGMADRERRRRIVENLIDRVGLERDDYDRYPHEFSGGQKQRLGLARALVLNPDLIIADEPVSALDVSIKAEILSLLDELQTEFDLSLLFISHDMSVIQEVSDRVAVMYLGEIVELGPTETVFENPQHPYTEALLSSIPQPDPRAAMDKIELHGTVPDPSNPPSGCRFHTRCHRVLQPADLDLEQSSWRNLITFREQVLSDAIDIETVRKQLAAEGETEAVADADLKARLRTEFDLDAPLASERAEEQFETVLSHLVSEEPEAARELLETTFISPCAKKQPATTEHAGDHQSACHLHEERDAATESTELLQ
ncbi:oligopeptide/dipeptide ABC transporter, ATP-binding protein [Halovivax ruber XH-70]|uniref:Oligopeptide/dipeptide ABC transporter, ATP-binding protein n=1 Tax=Halovivax ruber (strain DSM 18193 / JCM 13892 / XH-70) TaxID=797302 RepID=L0I7X1_HALRX|nr:ABC transporter ATP-binding protein [Halovivax ruber]AGB15695.1 oligopeptide/dipeptide ABC transporter, ATP-binding protein [Halovivax ruber XH-70]